MNKATKPEDVQHVIRWVLNHHDLDRLRPKTSRAMRQSRLGLTNPYINWFLGGNTSCIQQRTSVWVGSPKSAITL